MTKYNSASRQRVKKKPEIHPLWRGAGCLIMIFMPLFSFFTARALIDYGLTHNWVIPYQLLGNPRLPDYFYDVPILITIFGPVTRWTNIYAILALAFLILLVVGGFFSFVYALIYRYAGPPRWGPTDVPPPRIKVKRYRR